MTRQPAWHQRLTPRLLLFLTLALVPIGVISVLQNKRLSAEAERRSELSLLALTEQAASGERQLIQRAFGAAQALSGMAAQLLGDPQACRDILQRLQRSNANFVFAGFIHPDGVSRCSTAPRVLDFSAYPNFADLIANPRPNIEVNLNAPGSGQSVMIINQPHFHNEALEGYFSVSLPLRDVGQSVDFLGSADPITLVTFNANGQLLSTESARDRAVGSLPRDIALSELARGEARSFVAPNRRGQNHAYSVVPIVPDVVYALGSWRVGRIEGSGPISDVLDTALPFLMWLASLIVVWFVIHRLVIERVYQLNRAMDIFAHDRTLPRRADPRDATTELDMLESSFHDMAHDILNDEAQQEERLREKTVLLKEVHHRVKNNLQIISSIMNMQIRRASAEETRSALGQVQDRIMGLSGVHRTLYQSDNLTQVNAAALIEKIVEQSHAIGTTAQTPIAIDLDLCPVVIFPDQAVPLSMLVSEALTNAIKYIDNDAPRITISLTLDEADQARLVVENTLSEGPESEEPGSTGLGHQLIQAFASQLNGTLEAAQIQSSYRLDLKFQVEAFKKEPQDY